MTTATVTASTAQAIEPSRIKVVTAENFDDFVSESLKKPESVNPDPEAAAAEALAKVEADKKAAAGEDDDADEGEVDHPNKDKKNALQERIGKLTQKRKDAETKAKAEAERAAKLEGETKTEREARESAEKQVAELKAKYEPPPKAEQDPEPTPEQFQDVKEYAKALKDWSADNARREDARAASEARAAQAQAEAAKAWKERQEAATKEIPDYLEVIGKSSDVQVSEQMRDAILESEVGPKILYHLAKNPDEAKKLGEMTVGRMLRELGKLEASLSGEKSAPEPKKLSSVAEISKAPAPISPLRGASAPVGPKVDAKGEFYGTYEEFKAARLAGKIK